MTDTRTDPRFVVLNVVALKKMATAEQIAEVSGLPVPAVRDELERLSAEEFIAVLGDQALPQDTATAELDRIAAERYAGLRTDDGVLAMHDRFEVVNTQFLGQVSAWQQVEVAGRKIANDHSDAEYDAKVLGKIDRLVTRLIDLIGVLVPFDARFAGYAQRFRSAMDKSDTGDIEWVSSPVLDSVHTVWFEFHEDLLRTLGRERKE